jgi:tripartite-type tricarboxylate transporter receptor subunit TctC
VGPGIVGNTWLADPGIVARLRGIGVEPAPTSPDEFRQFLREETRKHAEWVRLAGIQLE